MNNLTSWIEVKPDCDFSIYNIPFGVAKLETGRKVAVSAIGNYVIDLDSLQNHFFLMSWIYRQIFSEQVV
jgi:fumarylacetoacetase